MTRRFPNKQIFQIKIFPDKVRNRAVSAEQHPERLRGQHRGTGAAGAETGAETGPEPDLTRSDSSAAQNCLPDSREDRDLQ